MPPAEFAVGAWHRQTEKHAYYAALVAASAERRATRAARAAVRGWAARLELVRAIGVAVQHLELRAVSRDLLNTGVAVIRAWARRARQRRALKMLHEVHQRHAALTFSAFRVQLENDPTFLADYERYAKTYGATRLPLQGTPDATPPVREVVESMWARHVLTRAWDRLCARPSVTSAPLGLWPLSHEAEARYCRAVQARLGRVLATVGAAASADAVGASFDRLLQGGEAKGVAGLVQGCVADFLVVLRAQAAPDAAPALRLTSSPRVLSPPAQPRALSPRARSPIARSPRALSSTASPRTLSPFAMAPRGAAESAAGLRLQASLPRAMTATVR